MKKVEFRISLITLSIILIGSTNLLAVTPDPATITQNGFWSFGISGVRHTLKAGDGNELLGNTLNISLGKGYLHHRWYSFGSLDILLGPFEPTRKKQLDVDYQGTGLTYWWGYSAQELDLRSPEGGYGFALGFEYSDIVGRSIGRNRKELINRSNPDNEGLIENYNMRVTNFSIVPAIFFLLV